MTYSDNQNSAIGINKDKSDTVADQQNAQIDFVNLPSEDKLALIAYLSEEIKTYSTLLMEFRTKISFSFWIGPVILLSSVVIGISKTGFKNPFTFFQWLCIVILMGSVYVIIGFMGGSAESQGWEKVNNCRKCIIKLLSSEPITTKELDNLIVDHRVIKHLYTTWIPIPGERRLRISSMEAAYFFAFTMMFIIFLITSFIAINFIIYGVEPTKENLNPTAVRLNAADIPINNMNQKSSSRPGDQMPKNNHSPVKQ